MKLLFVTHNVPFPPNKGEKIRSYHMIYELSKNHEIYLISFARDEEDLKYQADLEKFCKVVHLVRLHPLLSRIFALTALVLGYPITFGYFFSLHARKLINNLIETEKFDATFAVCSSAAQYLYPHKDQFTLIDYVDIDSAKWKQYAEISSFPMSWIYAIEHKRLGIWEKRLCDRFDLSLLTTEREKERLIELAKGQADKILVCPMGIDTKYFFPKDLPEKETRSIVFTGQMDYLPNIDAVIYFYRHVLPKILEKHSNVEFVIVGRNPDPKLKEVCVNAEITGEVEDVRPYLHSADVFVAPLRIAFGIQNKVLEAMACKIPVVSTSRILQGIKAKIGSDIIVADSPSEFANAVMELLENDSLRSQIASSGYNYVVSNHDWQSVGKLIEANLPKNM